jgi:hypothetical protein
MGGLLFKSFETRIKKGEAESYKLHSVLGKGTFGVVSKAEKSGVRLLKP